MVFILDQPNEKQLFSHNMHKNFKCHLNKADLDLLVYLKSFWDKKLPVVLLRINYPLQQKCETKVTS